MTLILFNISTGVVQLLPSSAQMLTTHHELVRVKLIEDTVSGATEKLLDLNAGDIVNFKLQKAGGVDGAILIIQGSIARNTTAGAYDIDIDALTDAVEALLKIGNNDATDDVLTQACTGSLNYVPAEGNPVQSLPFALTLVAANDLPGAGSPTTVPTPDSKYLRFDAVTQTLSGDDKTRVLGRIGAATEAQGALAATAVQPAALTSAVAAEATARNSAISTAIADKADLVGGKVPSSQLPSYVDDVVEAANFGALPGTGESGKIYIALDTGKTYRWSGSAYVEISATPALASQAEAEAGTDTAKLMTPLRTAQAIAVLGGGGGGGVAIVHQTGTLKSYDTVPSARVDASIFFSFASVSSGVLTINVNGTDYRITYDYSDPADGSYFADLTYISDVQGMADKVSSGLMALFAYAVPTLDYSGGITIQSSALGAAGSIMASASGALNFNSPGLPLSSFGSDAVDGGGAVTEIELVPAVAGKTARLISAGMHGSFAADHVYLSYKSGGVYNNIIDPIEFSSDSLVPGPNINQTLLIGGVEGASIVARYTDNPGDLTTSLEKHFWVAASQS